MSVKYVCKFELMSFAYLAFWKLKGKMILEAQTSEENCFVGDYGRFSNIIPLLSSQKSGVMLKLLFQRIARYVVLVIHANVFRISLIIIA